MHKNEKLVVALTAPSHGLVHVFELTLPAVLPFMAQEYGGGLFLLGVLANVFALAFGVSALPAGFLTDRVGSKRLIVLCFLGAVVGGLMMGLVRSPYGLALALGVLGFATGLYHPAGFAFITRSIQRPGHALGLHGIGGNLGLALTPFAAAAVAAMLGWRNVYLLLVVPALLLALAIALSGVREGSEEIRQRSGEGVAGSLRGALVPLALIYGTLILAGFIYRGVITFLPTYLSQSSGVEFLAWDRVTLAGFLTTATLLFGIFGQYLGGRLTDRVPMERLYLLCFCVSSPALLGVGLSSGLLMLPVIAIYAFFNFFAQPVQTALVAKYVPYRFHGAAFGLSFFFMFGLGSFSATFSGYLADRLGLQAVFIVLGLLALVILALVLTLWAYARRFEGTKVPSEVAVEADLRRQEA